MDPFLQREQQESLSCLPLKSMLDLSVFRCWILRMTVVWMEFLDTSRFPWSSKPSSNRHIIVHPLHSAWWKTAWAFCADVMDSYETQTLKPCRFVSRYPTPEFLRKSTNESSDTLLEKPVKYNTLLRSPERSRSCGAIISLVRASFAFLADKMSSYLATHVGL